ncbi:hypothetical protein D3C71_1412310 [compost metagenome]
MAPPRAVPELASAEARPCSLRGNQLLTVLLMVVLNGPSAMPNSTRRSNRLMKLKAKAVAPQNSDHSSMATIMTRRGP